MTILYIKVEANVVSNVFRRLPMVHHTNKLSDTTMEEYTYEFLCLDSLFISDSTYCFSLDIE